MTPTLFLALVIAAVGTPEVKAPTGPTRDVFLTATEIFAARARCEQAPWAAAQRAKILETAQTFYARPRDIPPKGGQWTHSYVCRDDSTRLKARTPTEHVCPKCSEVYTGFPYDEAYISQVHQRNGRGMAALADAFYLDPKPEYAAHLREMFLEYASFYPDLPLHDIFGKDELPGKARLFAQTLDEATWMVDMLYAYDAVYDTRAFSEADHKLLEERLLRPMVETIRGHLVLMSNWQSWHNAAVFAAGVILRDHEYMNAAVNGGGGLMEQLEFAVLPGGFWNERTPFYHFYALNALVMHLQAAERAGISLWNLPQVRGLFDAPLQIVFPDLTFPALNNSDRFPLESRRQFYEIAYAKYEDPRYLQIAQPRGSNWGVFWGADATAESASAQVDLPSGAVPGYGLAILRNNERGIAAYLDFVEQRSVHLQDARLSIILYAQDNERLIDPGVAAYGSKLQGEWLRKALAHNTVVVDGQVQSENGIAHLAAYAKFDNFEVVRAGGQDLYPGVALDRTLILWNNVLIDVFRCDSEGPATFDLPMHMRGTLEGLGATVPADDLNAGPSYEYLSDGERYVAPIESFNLLTGDGRRIHVQVHERSTAYRAKGPYPDADQISTVIRRRKGNTAIFVTSYHILRENETPATVGFVYGRPVRINFGGNAVLISDYTRVVSEGMVHEIGRDGISFSYPES